MRDGREKTRTSERATGRSTYSYHSTPPTHQDDRSIIRTCARRLLTTYQHHILIAATRHAVLGRASGLFGGYRNGNFSNRHHIEAGHQGTYHRRNRHRCDDEAHHCHLVPSILIHFSRRFYTFSPFVSIESSCSRHAIDMRLGNEGREGRKIVPVMLPVLTLTRASIYPCVIVV